MVILFLLSDYFLRRVIAFTCLSATISLLLFFSNALAAEGSMGLAATYCDQGKVLADKGIVERKVLLINHLITKFDELKKFESTANGLAVLDERIELLLEQRSLCENAESGLVCLPDGDYNCSPAQKLNDDDCGELQGEPYSYKWVAGQGCCSGEKCVSKDEIPEVKKQIDQCNADFVKTEIACNEAKEMLADKTEIMSEEDGIEKLCREGAKTNRKAADVCDTPGKNCTKSCKIAEKNWAGASRILDQCSTHGKVAQTARRSAKGLDDCAGQSAWDKTKEGLQAMAPYTGQILEGIGSLMSGRGGGGSGGGGSGGDVGGNLGKPTVDTCKEHPNSPECYCMMNGYNAEGCNPYSGKGTNRVASKSERGGLSDSDLEDMLNAGMVGANLGEGEAKPNKVNAVSGRGGSGFGGGPSSVGPGEKLGDGKRKQQGSYLGNTVEVGKGSTTGYSYGAAGRSRERGDLYDREGKRIGGALGDLKKLMPGFRNPAAYAREVTGANGKSNFEKAREKYKLRCPYMKKDYCI